MPLLHGPASKTSAGPRHDSRGEHLGGAGRGAEVRRLAGGNETVPTLAIGDQILVNPSSRRALEAITTHALDLIGPVSAGRWSRLRHRDSNKI